MRIRVSQLTVFRYDPPAKSLIQTLRLTPRNHDGQFVVRWRVDVDIDGRLHQGEDAFANITHPPSSTCATAAWLRSTKPCGVSPRRLRSRPGPTGWAACTG